MLYGYDVMKTLDEHGELQRGTRTVNAHEAEIVRRIFREYCAGKSGRAIAVDLNKEGIPGPQGGTWGFSTINGNPKRGTGILNNELYIGKLVWNRQRFVKDPDTGRRQARPNPESEWITQAVPELRIVSDVDWNHAKSRQARLSMDTVEGVVDRTRPRNRPKYILSGLTRCGCCGGAFTLISGTALGCTSSRSKGTCDNRYTIRRDRLEDRVLRALRHHLMDPALFSEFCDEFTQEMNRLRKEAGKAISATRAEIAKIDRDLDKLVDMILRGGNADKINQRMLKMEARKRDLEARLAATKEPLPTLHPRMAHHYREQLDNLTLALSAGDECNRLKATEIIRSLIERIVLTPEGSDLVVDVQGDLAGILTIAAQRKKPARKAGSEKASKSADVLQFAMVAGAGFPCWYNFGFRSYTNVGCGRTQPLSV